MCWTCAPVPEGRLSSCCRPASLVCNDVDYLRMKRVVSVLDQYLGRDRGIGGARDTVTISRKDRVELLDYEPRSTRPMTGCCWMHPVTVIDMQSRRRKGTYLSRDKSVCWHS